MKSTEIDSRRARLSNADARKQNIRTFFASAIYAVVILFILSFFASYLLMLLPLPVIAPEGSVSALTPYLSFWNAIQAVLRGDFSFDGFIIHVIWAGITLVMMLITYLIPMAVKANKAEIKGKGYIFIFWLRLWPIKPRWLKEYVNAEYFEAVKKATLDRDEARDVWGKFNVRMLQAEEQPQAYDSEGKAIAIWSKRDIRLWKKERVKALKLKKKSLKMAKKALKESRKQYKAEYLQSKKIYKKEREFYKKAKKSDKLNTEYFDSQKKKLTKESRKASLNYHKKGIKWKKEQQRERLENAKKRLKQAKKDRKAAKTLYKLRKAELRDRKKELRKARIPLRKAKRNLKTEHKSEKKGLRNFRLVAKAEKRRLKRAYEDARDQYDRACRALKKETGNLWRDRKKANAIIGRVCLHNRQVMEEERGLFSFWLKTVILCLFVGITYVLYGKYAAKSADISASSIIFTKNQLWTHLLLIVCIFVHIFNGALAATVLPLQLSKRGHMFYHFDNIGLNIDGSRKAIQTGFTDAVSEDLSESILQIERREISVAMFFWRTCIQIFFTIVLGLLYFGLWSLVKVDSTTYPSNFASLGNILLLVGFGIMTIAFMLVVNYVFGVNEYDWNCLHESVKRKRRLGFLLPMWLLFAGSMVMLVLMILLQQMSVANLVFFAIFAFITALTISLDTIIYPRNERKLSQEDFFLMPGDSRDPDNVG